MTTTTSRPTTTTTTTGKTTTTTPQKTTTTGRPTTTTTTTQKTTTTTAPPKSTTTTRIPSTTTTTIDVENAENKTDTECTGQNCQNPVLTDPVSDSTEDNSVDETIQTGNTQEPKAAPAIWQDSGSGAPHSSLLFVLNTILVLIVISNIG